MSNNKAEINIHVNHRKRLSETVFKSGLKNINSLQQLEYLLTLLIPRKDVNPIAHELLEKFENITNVLNASDELLKNVKGLGEASVRKIHNLKQICEIYRENSEKAITINTLSDLYYYAISLIKYNSPEAFFCICLDETNKIVYKQKLLGFKNDEINVRIAEIIELIMANKNRKFIFIHNHPNGKSNPSKEDNESTKKLQEYCRIFGVSFVDHIVIGKTSFYSFSRTEEISYESLKNQSL